MCIKLSSPRKLVLREGLGGEVALHDAATGDRLGGQSRVELTQEPGKTTKIIVTFEVGDSVSLGERRQITVRGESGPDLEVAGPARINSASQTAELLSGGQRVDLSGMLDALKSIARQAEILERWDHEGLPAPRATT